MAKKYSLWKVVHESIWVVNLEKERDTDSSKEVEKWENEHYNNVASGYREEQTINANYVQTFSKDE